MSIECVELAEEHIPEVIDLMREYWTWQASQVPTYLNVSLFQALDYDQYIRVHTLENPCAKSWVALNRGKVVGFARVEMQRADRYRAFRRFLLVDDIIVSSIGKRLRAGDILLDQVERYAHEQAIHSLFTRVYASDEQDREWFLAQGFLPMHTEYLKEL